MDKGMAYYKCPDVFDTDCNRNKYAIYRYGQYNLYDRICQGSQVA